MTKHQITEANAANREFIDGKLSFDDFMAIIHDLVKPKDV